MSGDRFDYSSERQRHEKFVGRAGLLTRLDRLLVESDTDHWVVITGGPVPPSRGRKLARRDRFLTALAAGSRVCS